MTADGAANDMRKPTIKSIKKNNSAQFLKYHSLDMLTT